MSGIYDATLAIGGAANLAVTGSYVKVYSAPAGAVQLKLDGGEAYTLMEGQGVRLPDGAHWFRDVQLLNKSGNVQTVQIFVGDSRFEDTRITGTVSVVDGGKARTTASQAFMGYSGVTAAAAQFPCVQLYNPSATKRLVVKSIAFSASASGIVSISQLATTLALGPVDVYSKLIAAPAAMTGKLYRDSLAAVPGNIFMAYTVAANTVVTQLLQEPFVIPPSQGIVCTLQVAASLLLANFEGYEEANV